MLKPIVAGLSIASALGFHFALTSALPVETLRAVASMPAHIAGTFNDVAACHTTPDGEYLVFDRRAHSVYRVPSKGPAKQIIQIGVEPGRILLPLAFDSASDGTFVIADSPQGTERVQIFFYLGGAAGGFTLPTRTVPQVALGDLVLSGLGSVNCTCKNVFRSAPLSDEVVTERRHGGEVVRTFCELRATGREQALELQLALHGGMAISLPGVEGF